MTGIYVVLAELNHEQDVQVGKKKNFAFREGFYGYVGSALVNLEKRIARHIKPDKKLHWHIDYLLQTARVRAVIYAETAEKKECALARELIQKLPSIKGFGASDCKCPSHLFFSRDSAEFQGVIVDSFKAIKLTPVQIDF